MRTLVTALLLGALMSISACQRSGPQTSTAETTAIRPSEQAQPTAAKAAASETPAQAAAADASANAPEPVSEFDNDVESVENAPPATAAQPLALRIAEMQAAPPSQFKEGVHYARLVPAQPTSAGASQVEITEAFWYGCPHCYALDPYLESWRKQGKPAYVNFVRIPVIWNDRTRIHARVFYTAELLGKLDELHGAIFDEIHVNKNPLSSPESIAKFFAAHGVDADAFEKAFASFGVEESLKKATALNERYRVDSVPTIVINGKYVTDVGRAGGQKELIALINELASRERGT